jgi:two-component system, NarL family, response regulator DevR
VNLLGTVKPWSALLTTRSISGGWPKLKEESASVFANLSHQEKRVLLLVSEGQTNREIARNLFLSEGTVRNYMSSVLSKLCMNNRVEAAAYAVQHNLREYITI